MNHADPSPAAEPPNDGIDNADDHTVMDRYETLQRSARLLVNGYYENFVLSVYKGLRDRSADLFLRRLANGTSSALDQDLIFARGQQVASTRVLQAILSTWRTAGRSGLSTADIDLDLRRQAEPGQVPIDFNAFLTPKLAERRGYPVLDPAHWLTCYHDARELHHAIREGTYVDYALTGNPPAAFREPPAALALTVEQSRSALDGARRAETVARFRLSHAEDGKLADAIERSARAHRQAQLRVSQADDRLDRTYADYAAALGPSGPHPSGGRVAPAPGRGR